MKKLVIIQAMNVDWTRLSLIWRKVPFMKKTEKSEFYVNHLLTLQNCESKLKLYISGSSKKLTFRKHLVSQIREKYLSRVH